MLNLASFSPRDLALLFKKKCNNRLELVNKMKSNIATTGWKTTAKPDKKTSKITSETRFIVLANIPTYNKLQPVERANSVSWLDRRLKNNKSFDSNKCVR
jgi:hypothetical protein